MTIQSEYHNLLQGSDKVVGHLSTRLYKLFQKYFDWPISYEQFQVGLFKRLPGLRTDRLWLYKVNGKDVGYFHFRTYIRQLSSSQVMVVRMSVGADKCYRKQLPWKWQMVREILAELIRAGGVQHIFAINWLTHPSSYAQCFRNFETYPAPPWHIQGRYQNALQDAFQPLMSEYPFKIDNMSDDKKPLLSSTGATVKISPEEIDYWKQDPYGRYFIDHIKPGHGFPTISRVTIMSLFLGLKRFTSGRLKRFCGSFG